MKRFGILLVILGLLSVIFGVLENNDIITTGIIDSTTPGGIWIAIGIITFLLGAILGFLLQMKAPQSKLPLDN